MNVEKLYQKAQELLHEGRNIEARDVGHQLLKLRFSGAFEILARSFHQEGALRETHRRLLVSIRRV